MYALVSWDIVVMENPNSRRRRQNCRRTITISLDLPAEDEGNRQNVAPNYGYNEDGLGAPVVEAFQGRQECIFNIPAAKFVVDVRERETNLPFFSEKFHKYHEACVQVIAKNTEDRGQIGSGILLEHSRTELLLITSAHVITDVKCNVTIVLEVGHTRMKKQNKARATQVVINLERYRLFRNSTDDVAGIFFAKTSTAGKLVLEHVKEFPSIGFQGFHSNYFMAIHYGNSGKKSVSVGNRLNPGIFQSLDMSVYIGGGEGASGAPLFNYKGEVVAILRSKATHVAGQRHFEAFQDIDVQNFNSNTNCEPRVFEIFEGRKFKQKLAENNGHFGLTVFQCLGVGGLHGKTRQYSRRKMIESDHFPAYNAYDIASKYENCPAVVKSILTGGGDRPGENNLPAIIIPKVIHRKLATTVSSSFRREQANHIRLMEFPEAIRKNFDDYSAKGLFRRDNYRCHDDTFDALIENYVAGFVEALQQHQTLRFIQREDRLRLEGYIEALARNGRERGGQLDRNKIISLQH